MREILFRGKNKNAQNWIEGDLIHLPNGIAILSNGYAYIDPSTVDQYTGLTDRNGVKIFEGDIIRNHKGLLGRVTYMPEHCAFMIYITSENRYCYLWDNDFTKIEVIGNIHDNPDLLEAQHENT